MAARTFPSTIIDIGGHRTPPTGSARCILAGVSARPSLDFTRDAARLVVRSATGVHIVDVAGHAPAVEIPLPGVVEVAAIGDQIWAVAGEPPRLHRLTIAGDAIGTPVLLAGSGRLRRTAGRELAAAWTGAPPSILLADGDTVTATALPGEPDAVVPVSSARWLLCRRDRVTLREATSERWTTSIGGRGDRVLDGAILFDGRSVALLVEQAGDPPSRQLLVLGLHEPLVQHRLTLAGVDAVRFAPARGFALLRAERRLLVVDLRFGRVLKEHETERELTDLAIDDTAQHIALRFADGDDVIHLAVRALLAAPARRPSADEAGDAVMPPAALTVVEAAAAPPPPAEEPAPAAAFHHGDARLLAAAALAPRPAFVATSRGESIALLDRYRVLASALIGRAIAYAWDQGRLTFPTEGGLPFKTEVAGLLGRNSGLAVEDVRTFEQAVVEALAAVRAAEASTGGRVAPLAAIAREFELSTIAQLILIVVAAPALWGETARLYGILANDEGRPLCDELLVHQILGSQTSRHDIARQLDRDAPLIRHGLIRPGEGRMRPFMALTAEPIVLRLLRGTDAEADVDDVRIIAATRSFDELFIPAAVKDRIAREVATPRAEPTRIVVRGRTGSGRHTLLATLAAAADRRLGVIDATPIVRDLRGRADQLRTALRRAHLLGLLPCVDGLETIASDDQAAKDVVREVLRGHPGPLAVRLPWDGAAPLDPGHLLFDLPALSIDQRLGAWEAILTANELAMRDPTELALRYSVGPGVVSRVCAQVAADRREQTDGAAPDVAAALDTAIRQHLETRLTATASRVTRLATWSKVVLPPDILDSLLELIARIKHRRTVYETWGFDTVMSTSRGVTALFQGGPGTGKTLVASAIASELGMDLYRVDISRIMSKWIGETEQNLAKLFDAAEDGHAIILFDEADSLFAKRTEVRTSVDRYANLEVNYLLQRLDSFEGIAILTTNFGTSIDTAFKRRLSFRLTFPFPDEEMREMLWKAHLPPEVPKAGEFDLGALARRYRLSGGYIRNAALRAAFLAAEEHTPLTQEHLERAIKAEFREIGKLADSGVLE